MFHSYRSGKKKRDINFLRAEATHSPEVLDVAIPLFVLGCAIWIEGTNTTCNIHIKKNPSNNLWCRSEVYQKLSTTKLLASWFGHFMVRLITSRTLLNLNSFLGWNWRVLGHSHEFSVVFNHGNAKSPICDLWMIFPTKKNNTSKKVISQLAMITGVSAS